jgi:hypothetical protein
LKIKHGQKFLKYERYPIKVTLQRQWRFTHRSGNLPDKMSHAMKLKRFTEEQIAFALRQAESGNTVEEMPENGRDFFIFASACAARHIESAPDAHQATGKQKVV